MRAWMFHNMVDMWGNIPYSEALGGLANNNITPAYDDAQSIYSALLAELLRSQFPDRADGLPVRRRVPGNGREPRSPL